MITSFYIALPGILIYGLGIPAGVFYLMRRDRDRLDTVIVKEKFGFLFNGFKRKYYFWEIMIMYRKVLMIFISVFLNRIGLIVQALVILIVLVCFIQVNNLKRPFADRSLNEIENLSLLTATITIYCGIFFLSAEDPSSASYDKNTDFTLSETGSIFLFLLIAGSNVLFMLIWSVKFYFIVREMVRDKYPKWYIYIFLCCRKDRWVRENIQRAKNEKNEYMIAKIEDIQYFMKDMKSLYINRVNYEGHEDFMKLLYIIEGIKPKIDMTIKKNEYNVDGKIARERRFDPEHLKNVLDEKRLEVRESFGSRASYSGSAGSPSRSKQDKSERDNEFASEKFIPPSREALMDYFERRTDVRKMNRDYFRIYDGLANDKHDLTPIPNTVEESKMHKLEDHFLKKFINSTNTGPGKSKSRSKYGTVSHSHQKALFTRHSNPSLVEDPDITQEVDIDTTNNMMKEYQDFEEDAIVPDNEMSNIKKSRNAKILMPRTKITQTKDEKHPRVNPSYNLPKGMPMEESNLKVKDYDESSDGSEANAKSAIKTPIKTDHLSKAGNDDFYHMGLRQIIESSFSKPIDKRVNLKVESLSSSKTSMHPSSKTQNKSSNDSDDEEEDKVGETEMRPQLTNRNAKKNSLVLPNFKEIHQERRISKVTDLRRNESPSVSDESERKPKWKKRTTNKLEDMKFSVNKFRKSYVDMISDEPKQTEKKEVKELEIDMDECLDSIEEP